MKKIILFLSLIVFMFTGCDLFGSKEEKKPEAKPMVIENEDGSTFTVTPEGLDLANYSISEDKKTLYLGGKTIKSDDGAVTDGYAPESYTLTGKFYGQIVVNWDEVEVVLSDATITAENSPALSGNCKTFISSKDGTSNYLISSGKDSVNDKSAAVLIDGSVDVGGKGTLYVNGSITHGLKAKKVELKGSGNYYFQGTDKGSAINCNSFKVKEEKTFTAYIANSKNGIKADNTIDISSGTFNFEKVKTALKTDTKADDSEGEEKDHYIKLSGGTFNYDSTVEKFASTEKGEFSTEGAVINGN